MTASATNWVERCEAALDGQTTNDVEVVRGRRPPILDAAAVRALATPVMAALFWSAATFRDTIAADPLDALSLLLRLLALAFTVRTLVFFAQMTRRLHTWTQHARYALAISEDGLLVRTPRNDFALTRDDVVDAVEHGHWGERSARRWAEVYVVTRPESGRLYVALPPVLDATPGVLAERLMRWRGPVGTPDTPATTEPTELLSKLWEDIRGGARPPGVAVVGHSLGWLKRGPWATALLGAAVFERWTQLPPETSQAVGMAPPLLAMFCLVAVPLGWILWARREIAHRGGIALVLTPRDMLLRTRAGVQRIPWSQVVRVELDARRIWSMLQGAHQSRALSFQRKNEAPVVIAEMILAVPAEVALAIADAYRKGRLAPST